MSGSLFSFHLSVSYGANVNVLFTKIVDCWLLGIKDKAGGGMAHQNCILYNTQYVWTGNTLEVLQEEVNSSLAYWGKGGVHPVPVDGTGPPQSAKSLSMNIKKI